MRPVLLLSLALAVACAQADSGPPRVDRVLPRAAAWAPDLWSGGQPSPRQLEKLAAAGVSVIVNLRPDGEPGAMADEADRVEALDMEYVHIPVAGAADISEANARRLHEVLEAHAGEKVVVHCKSGNRVGALAALRARYVLGQPPEAALEEGEKAGLTALRSLVVRQLGAD